MARQPADGTVTLEDLSDGTVLGTISAPDDPSVLFLGLAISPNATNVIEVSQSLTSSNVFIVQRNITDPNLLRTACATAGRNLTPAQWSSYLATAPTSDLSCR